MNTIRHSSLTTRQRMINLMYLVFIALLALNISSDAWEDFDLLDNSLQDTVKRIEKQNSRIYYSLHTSFLFDEFMHFRLENVQILKQKADSLCEYIEEIKRMMLHEANRGKRKFNKLTSEPVAHILFSPRKGEGGNFQSQWEQYREGVALFLSGETGQEEIPETWNIQLFENKTLFVVLPFLTKMQLDIRRMENTVLHTLQQDIFSGSLPGSTLKAYIVPAANPVLSGGTYEGKVVVAVEDTLLVRNIIFPGQNVIYNENGQFRFFATGEGERVLKGYAEVTFNGSSFLKLPLETTYHVTDPSLTIGWRGRHLLYAGYPNPLQIAIPGVPTEVLQVSSSHGSIEKKGKNIWQVLVPESEETVLLSITYAWKGKEYKEDVSFKVLPLPDPVIGIRAQGSLYKAEKMDKALLLKSEELAIFYEDGFPDRGFDVLSFELNWNDSFGNRLSELSQGRAFTNRQKEILKGLSKGKTVWLSNIQLRGMDGSHRTLPGLELILN
ncbi:MAG: hypothetical protein LUG98_08105 [Tannerellaceae bacterium]|nr:hypothetical protein [Tannerellaceae bacterium]